MLNVKENKYFESYPDCIYFILYIKFSQLASATQESPWQVSIFY